MKKISVKRWAQMWCELNCWETPKELGKEALDRVQIYGAMRVCKLMTTTKEIDR